MSRELLQRALDALEAITSHFTRTPSTLADTQMRGYAHATMHMLHAALAAPVAPAAWLMDSDDDASWVEIGPKQPAPEPGFVAVPLYR